MQLTMPPHGFFLEDITYVINDRVTASQQKFSS